MRLLLLSIVTVCVSALFLKAQPVSCDEVADTPPGCILCGSVYTGSTWFYMPDNPGLDFPCGTIENNVWISVITESTSLTVSVRDSNCIFSQGVQCVVYDSGFRLVSECLLSRGMNTDTIENLIPGTTYLVMVDGYYGDYCDFTLTVDGAKTPEMLGLTGPVSQVPEGNNICTGTEVCYSITSVDNATGYIWKIPSNASIISGGGVDDLEVCVKYNSPGIGTVCVNPYNTCFYGDEICRELIVKNIPLTEIPPIQLGPDEFPIEIDGRIFTDPGQYEFTLTTQTGCDSTILYDILSCEDRYSTLEATICKGATFSIGNSNYEEAGNYQVKLAGQGAGGCDSIVNLTLIVINEIEITAYENVISCPDDCQDLTVEANLSDPANTTFQWTSVDGMITGPIDDLSTRVCGAGLYRLTFSNSNTGNSCSVETTIPEFPSLQDLSGVTFHSVDSCPGTVIRFETDNLSQATGYNWIIPAGSEIFDGGGSSAVELAFREPGTYTVCVQANNSCDTSNIACTDFTVIAEPVGAFKWTKIFVKIKPQQ